MRSISVVVVEPSVGDRLDVAERVEQMVAVGTEVTLRPPHRSVRAELPHTAPASGM